VAIAHDQALGTGNSSGVLSTTLTTGIATASLGHIVLLAGRFNNIAAAMSVSGGGLTWATAHSNIVSTLGMAIFYAPFSSVVASGTVLTVTHASGTPDCIIGARSYTGIDTAGTVTAFNAGSSSTTPWTSGNVAGASTNALIGGAFRDGGTATSSTPGGSANERFDLNVPGQSETLVFEDILSIAGTTALTGTWDATTSSVSIAASFKAATAAAATLPLKSRIIRPRSVVRSGARFAR
jgi:hypothetical protein